MVLPKQPTHWLTINEDEWDMVEFILKNECEDWWNPEAGEFPIINPTSQFIHWCEIHSLNLYGPKTVGKTDKTNK